MFSMHTIFSIIALLFNSTTSCFVVSSASDPFRSTHLNQIVEKATDPTESSGENPISRLDTTMVAQERKSLVRNFRLSAGLKRIYRCANTDDLGILYMSKDSARDNEFGSNEKDGSPQYDESSPEHVLLYKAGLILDLRSNSERNESKASSWMSKAPGGRFDVKKFGRGAPMMDFTASVSPGTDSGSSVERFVYRIDVLSPKRLFDYLANNWLTSPVQRAQYSFCFAFDTQKLHEIRMDVLNSKGIQGTYEAILETSGAELFASLKAITEYLVSHAEGDVVVHCVKGKDRTGLVVMLCQSILGIDDAAIIQDYHKSEKLLKVGKEEKDWTNIVGKDKEENVKGKLNRNFFSGAPEEAMVSTIAFIRQTYGSTDTYLDSIGFDETWRRRFVASQTRETRNLNSNL